MIRRLLAKLATPSYEALIGRANNELHQFHLLKAINWVAAEKHRKLAYKLFEQARNLK